MAKFFAELQRRHVVRVGAAYAIVAWLLLQIVANVAPILDLPPWIARAVLLVLVIGFPVSLVFAWVQQLAADGHTRAGRGALDWVLAGALIVVIALVSYTQLVPRQQVQPAEAQQGGVEAARTAASVPAGVSIAVLPLDNLSGDSAQEFFSDGMTEEITTALAKVPDLRVVGRTSAYQFKGKSQDLRAIGQALAVTHLIEGSVRKAGDRVRITAQLIKVDDGTHVWAENYDRQLTDIFAIQEDIAQAIAGALRLPLGLAPGNNLVSSRSIEPELYQQFLRARALPRARSPGYREAMRKILEAVVARDPGYAPAWALLAGTYGRQDPDKAEKAAREALRLDPGNAMANSHLANVEAGHGNFTAAEDIQKQSLALHPDDTDVLDAISNGLLAISGRVKEAVSMRERLRTLEPFVPFYNYITASILLNNGQSQTAIAMLKELPAGPAGGGEGGRGITLARAHAMEGRYGEAADTLLAIPQRDQQERQLIEEAARLLRNAPTQVSMPDALPAWDGELGFVYVYIGAPERVLDYPERLAAAHNLNPPALRHLWSPEFAPVRKTERFKALVRAVGFVEYWRARGWPDHCHPIGTDDFACD
jgi:TolB-like protein